MARNRQLAGANLAARTHPQRLRRGSFASVADLIAAIAKALVGSGSARKTATRPDQIQNTYDLLYFDLNGDLDLTNDGVGNPKNTRIRIKCSIPRIPLAGEASSSEAVPMDAFPCLLRSAPIVIVNRKPSVSHVPGALSRLSKDWLRISPVG